MSAMWGLFKLLRENVRIKEIPSAKQGINNITYLNGKFSDSLGKIALVVYNTALKINPLNIDTLNLRANVYADLSDYDDAIKDLNKVIELRPNFADSYITHFNRGLLNLKLRNYYKAIEDFEYSVSNDSTHTLGLNQLGIVFLETKDYAKALLYFDSSKSLNSRKIDYYHRGLAECKLNLLRDAMADRDKLLAFGNTQRLFDLESEIDLKLKSYRLALEHCNRAIEYGETAELFNRRGFIYFQNRMYKQATEDYEKAMVLGGNGYIPQYVYKN